MFGRENIDGLSISPKKIKVKQKVGRLNFSKLIGNCQIRHQSFLSHATLNLAQIKCSTLKKKLLVPTHPHTGWDRAQH